MKIVSVAKILRANEQLAEENRQRFDAASVACINVVGSPGAGKTTLLEGLFAQIEDRARPAVIEGDIAGAYDAQRIEALGVPVIQINTDGACHLDANMIAAAIEGVDYSDIDMLFIENVGNLVCTAGYNLGEHVRIVVLSTSEGDDKAAKYPAIFQGSDALVITKTDLKAHLNFATDRITADLKRLKPGAAVFEVAAMQGEGIPAVVEWLVAKCRMT